MSWVESGLVGIKFTLNCQLLINGVVHAIKEHFKWHHTFVYGANKPLDRRPLWQNLSSMKLNVAANPWIICGDFNVVRKLDEKWGSVSLNLYEKEFDDFLNNLEVTDLNSSGCFFTWNNKSEGSGFIARKLDRVLVNEDWLCNFGKTIVDFPPCGVSDHSPAFISVGTLVSFGPKPFKFFNYWLEHDSFMDWLADSWGQGFPGVPMFQLCKKLKAFKAVLKEKTSSFYGDLKRRVNKAKTCLDLAQHAVLESHGRLDCLIKERECLHAYVSTIKAEEAFLKQKARNQWLQLGDQNNAFFHRMLKGRQARNNISFLLDDQGNQVEDIDGIKGMAEEFYKKLLGTQHMSFTEEYATRIRQLLPNAISAEKGLLLEKEITAEEIKQTFFSMKANKAPGPDGFTYQKKIKNLKLLDLL
jgi:hypothetical protein